MGNCLGHGCIPFDSILSEEILSAEGEAWSTYEILSNKLVILFFGAQWCPPCRQFKPMLKEFKNILDKSENMPIGVEIVYMSLDYSEEEMMGAMEKTYYALPFEHEARERLERRFMVEELPSVIVLGPNGKVVSRHGLQQIKAHGIEAYTLWLSKCKN